MKPQLEHALELIERGVSLIAYEVKNGEKIPWCTWSTDLLPITSKKILLEVAEKPHCHGFQFRAIDAGLCVIDIDIKNNKDGMKSLMECAEEFGIRIDKSLSQGCVVSTPNNGFHVYAKTDEYLSTLSHKGILEGIDLFCDRSTLVVVPGSVCPDKNGEWKTYTMQGHIDNAPPMPRDLSNMFRSIRDRIEAVKAEKQAQAIAVRDINKSTFVYSEGTIFEEARSRISASLITELFSSTGSMWKGDEFWTKNPIRSDNSIGSFSINSRGLWHDFAESMSGDFLTLINEYYSLNSIYDSACTIIELTGGNPTDYAGEIMDDPRVKVSWEDVYASIKNPAYHDNNEDQDSPIEPQIQEHESILRVKQAMETKSTSEPVFLIQKIGERNRVGKDWLIKGLLPAKSMNTFYGASYCGKSYVVLDMAMHISHGKSYLGKKVQRTPFVYLAGEDFDGINDRALAWSKHHGIEIDANRSRIVDGVPLLGEPSHIVGIVKSIIDQMEELPKLLVLDTLSLSLGAIDPNSQMGVAVRGIIAMVSAFNCAVIVVHHTGHNEEASKRERNGSELGAGTAFRYFISNDGNGLVTVEGVKAKGEARPPEPFSFNFSRVNIAIDEDGDDISESILIPCEQKQKAEEKREELSLKKDAKMIINALTEQDHSIKTGEKGCLIGIVPDFSRMYSYEDLCGICENIGVIKTHISPAMHELSSNGLVAVTRSASTKAIISFTVTIKAVTCLYK